jgi:hypothetical protein
MSKSHKIMTNNKDIYEKLNMLLYSDEVIIKKIKCLRLNKIINNINKNGIVISKIENGDSYILRKNKPINFNVYFKF